MTTTLYKLTSTGKTQEWKQELEGDKYRTISGQKDGKKVTSAWTVCLPKNVGKSNEVTAEEQAVKEVEANYTLKRKGGYKDSEGAIADKPFQPMLAKNYGNYENVFPLYSQPKLDGIRCIAKADGLWSRKNTPITAVPHIWEALKPLFQKDPTLILDGELYNHVLNADFNSIVSMVRKHAPTESELMVAKALVQYHVYDLPSSSGSFSQRNKELLSLLSASPSCIVLVHTDKASNQADLDAQYDHYLSNSYEGQMVRVDAKYELKRSKTLLKRKESQDNEYTVLDIVEGTGNRAGMVGHVVVDLGGGKTCNPNPKGTREFLREVLANKAKYIGKQATVEFFGFTPDKNLRFPRVKAFHLNGRI